jgi:hypothetical protein
MTRFILSHPEARKRALQSVSEAPNGYSVTISEAKRSLDQGALFHAICNDIAKSGFEWGGKARDAATWKSLLISAHAVATKEPGINLMGLEGELVFLRESTAHMTKARATSLIEYALAWCASNGITVNDRSYYGY